MRWTSVVCLCIVAAHLVSSYPLEQSQSPARIETLSSVEASLGKPTSEHSERDKRTIGILRRIFPELSKETSRRKREAVEPEPAESENKQVRVPIVPDGSNDLKAAASGDAEEAESSHDDISEDVEEAESGENTRSKRLGVLGNLFGGGGGSSSGSSSGGSGNFLFDIIRRTADGAARAAGTVYRMVAGTDSETDLLAYNNDPLLLPQEMAVAAATLPTSTIKPSSAAAPPPPPAAPSSKPPLVAGSGATEQQDENANAPLAPGTPGDSPSGAPGDDGYQAGIPGPITRLFVIANRGIANLIQDLILRLAQTSERIVNFKARLITAII